MSLRRAVLALFAVLVAVLSLGVGTASAHVRASSPDATPGGFGEISFRTPSESATAKTTSVRVQLPTDTPFAFVSVKPVPGWTATTTTTPLDTPVEAEGATITEAVSEVAWTADPGGGLNPGEYETFSISAGPMPEGVDELSFPTLQGYDDGTTSSWIEPTVEGQAEPEHPAPTLSLTAASGEATTDGTTTTPDTTAAASDSGPSGLAITALILSIVGLLLGGTALALGARNGRRAPTAPEATRDRVDA